jgi:uncharacterized membrane protein YdjX (TVP38/TMEM64 family)
MFCVGPIYDIATNHVIAEHIKACLVQIQEHPFVGVIIYSALCLVATGEFIVKDWSLIFLLGFWISFFHGTVLCILMAVFFVPGSILTLGGGAAFGSSLGVVAGTIVAGGAVFVGASVGSIVSFLIGRYLLRDWAASWIEKYPFIQAIDQGALCAAYKQASAMILLFTIAISHSAAFCSFFAALKMKGLRILLLLRLSPSIPFNALNYALGVTGVPLSTYCYALFGMVPGTIMYVLLGATAGSIIFDGGGEGDNQNGGQGAESHNGLKLVLLILGIALDVCAVVFVTKYAKEELEKVSWA